MPVLVDMMDLIAERQPEIFRTAKEVSLSCFQNKSIAHCGSVRFRLATSLLWKRTRKGQSLDLLRETAAKANVKRTSGAVA